MSRQQLLDLLYERFDHFISQDRYISMEEALSYIIAQLEREGFVDFKNKEVPK